MKTMAYEFTENRYADRQQVAQALNFAMVDPVWSQIESYRAQFRQPLPLSKNQKTVCLCHHVMIKAVRLEETMRTLSYMLRVDPALDYAMADKNIGCLEPYALREAARSLIFSYLDIPAQPFQAVMKKVFLLFDMPISVELIQYLEDDTELWFLKLHEVLCQFEDLPLMRYTIFCLFMISSGFENLLKIINIVEMEPFVMLSDSNKDETYHLLHRFHQFRFQIEKSMLSCNQRRLNIDNDIKFSFDVLMHRYPQLQQHQIQFLLNHNNLGYYYTIRQYEAENSVCYETARSAMDQFVSLGFYKKAKQGKKYIYTVQ